MDYSSIFSSNFHSGVLSFYEPMKSHTTFRIGGPADVMFFPEKKEDILKCINICDENKIKYFIMGNGSNLLVSDAGIRGVVICIGKNMESVRLIDNVTIEAETGISLAKLSAFAYDNGLSGLEFASGIPGTLGGAVTMNAGAYGGEMKDIVKEVDLLDKSGRFFTLTLKQMGFAYRTSVIQKNDYIATGARLVLSPKDKKEISEKTAELNAKRKEKQPLDIPSAGSTFKRPEGYFAAKLIEDCGLKGYSEGGAMVSPKHAGFVVNTGGAACEDVRRLIDHVRNCVYEKFGILLELEVKIIGD